MTLELLNYYVFTALMLVGLYAMMTRRHLIRKVVGMMIFQTGAILFFISTAAKVDADIPIVRHAPVVIAEAAETHDDHDDDTHGADDTHGGDDGHDPSGHGDADHPRAKADDYVNPLPHVLMLTAIVVGVATLGVALGIILRIQEHFGTLDEDEILEKLR